jgi:thiamine-phosphate pyrophosphorylase
MSLDSAALNSASLASVSPAPAPLASAQLYLCTDSRPAQDDFEQFVDAAYAGGVDIIQLRDKQIDPARELELLDVLKAVAGRHGKPFAVNDRADIAALSGANVFHVGQDDLPVAAARRLLGPDVALGLSTHTPAQAAAAMDAAELDYFCTGPLWATPTKPGRAAVGLELVTAAARRQAETGSVRPWFAIGGIDHSNVEQVVDAGARRIVVVRAITEAEDPTEAARTLRALLPGLPAAR